MYAVGSLLSGEDVGVGNAPIAVLEIEGTILSSKDALETIKKIQKNKDVKAVVVRIDSPGGAVGPSQEIYLALKKLRETKHVVMSMASVAASGGYYIAIAGEKIFALPGTVTGSIGVLMQYVNVEELINFAKVKAEILKAGSHKDVGSMLRPMTPEDRAFLDGFLAHMHSQFKTAVREARGFTEEEIDRIADGRIYSGEQAKQLKLIDEIGGFDDAVAEAAKLGGVQGEPEVYYPGRKKDTLIQQLLREDAQSLIKKIYFDLKQSSPMYLM